MITPHISIKPYKLDISFYHNVSTVRTLTGEYLVFQKNISALDFLLFEEKRMAPTRTSFSRSIGFNFACEWYIPHCYDVLLNGTGKLEEMAIADNEIQSMIDCTIVPLTVDYLDGFKFEANHVLNLVANIGRAASTDTVKIMDEAESIANSDHFIYKDFEIKRLPMSWRDSPQILSMQQNKDLVRTSTTIITKYFLINDEPITEYMLKTPGEVDLVVLRFILARLGEFIRPA